MDATAAGPPLSLKHIVPLRQEKNPVSSVNMPGLELKVGSSVPDTVVLREVPDMKNRVAVINDEAVLVDPGTHQIVGILH